jgi:hypothetical protein
MAISARAMRTLWSLLLTQYGVWHSPENAIIVGATASFLASESDMTNATKYALAQIGVGPTVDTLKALDNVRHARAQHLVTRHDLAQSIRIYEMREQIQASKTARTMRIIENLIS